MAAGRSRTGAEAGDAGTYPHRVVNVAFVSLLVAAFGALAGGFGYFALRLGRQR